MSLILHNDVYIGRLNCKYVADLVIKWCFVYFMSGKARSSSNVGSATQHLWLPCAPLQLASASMARFMVIAARCMLLSMLAVTVMPGVFVTPPSGQVSKPCIRVSNISRMERSEPPSNAGTMLMAVVAGVMVAVVSPASSWAGTGGARPDFQVARPGYMQGIDAALAATKPGEIDHRIILKKAFKHFRVCFRSKQEHDCLNGILILSQDYVTRSRIEALVFQN